MLSLAAVPSPALQPISTVSRPGLSLSKPQSEFLPELTPYFYVCSDPVSFTHSTGTMPGPANNGNNDNTTTTNNGPN